MPYLKIQITNEKVTTAQKERLIKEATDMMVNVLSKDPETTFVIIEEVDTDNWGVGGISVTEQKKRKGVTK